MGRSGESWKNNSGRNGAEKSGLAKRKERFGRVKRGSGKAAAAATLTWKVLILGPGNISLRFC